MQEKEQSPADIYHVWAGAHAAGTEFFVDGDRVTYAEALQRAVREEGGYMADYILDESGSLKQIRLDRVNETKS